MDIDVDMTSCIRNQGKNRKEQKSDLHKKKNGSKKTGTLNTNQELKTKIKQAFNKIKIWNQIQDCAKFFQIFSSCAKEKVRKKLIETLDLLQKESI